MKKAILSLLFPLLLFSQNDKERMSIVSTYNNILIDSLKKNAFSKSIVQKALINDFKNKYGFKDSELLTLHRIEEDGTPIFYTIYNQGSSQTISTNKLYPGGSLGLSVTGQGMIAGVWDGGKVRDTHQEFSPSKVTLSDLATTLSTHATHVTGTIIASGVSSTRKGIAYGASAFTYDWNSDYDEMLSFGSGGYLASNHSYGYSTASLPTYKFGSYDASSIEVDDLSNAFPYYQIVIAAGNDRNDTGLAQVANKGGYDLLSGTATSKNGITVAAVEEVDSYIDSSSVIMSSFSNYGPTDDGRIKPDISAKGVSVSSCTSIGNTTYGLLSGTSMAAPAITGMILLLQKHYNNITNSYMKASTVRGLICHTAKEAGLYNGPDYEFGWGLANAEGSAQLISSKNITSIIDENNLVNGQIFTKNISISSTQKITATVCWTDPTGAGNIVGDEDNRVSRLKNNLDLKIIKDGNIYYPWKLNVLAETDPATNNSDNDVDNIEKVEIYDAPAGIYTIQVSHKNNLVGGAQDYSLIVSSTNGINLDVRNFEVNNSIFIYPNPTKNILNYQVKEGNSIDTITINDISGKVISNVNVNAPDSYIDVSNLSSGIYFVNFKSDDQIITKKFIKD